MDSGDSKKDGPTTRSRSSRQAPTQALSIKQLKRYPIKRTLKMREDEGASRAVNGSKESKSLTKEDEDESPVKKQKLKGKRSGIDEKGDGLNRTDDADMDTGENEDEDEAMSSDEGGELDQESSLTARPGTEDTHPAHVREQKHEYEEVLNRQNPVHLNIKVTEIPKPKAGMHKPVTKYEDDYSTGAPVEYQKRDFRKRINMNNQNPITEKYKYPPGFGGQNTYLKSKPQKSYVYPIIYQTNHKNKELTSLQQRVALKASPASSSSRGWTWYMCKLLLWCVILLLVLGVCGFLAYKKFSLSHLSQTDVVHSKSLEKFDPELSALRILFPSQRPVFWHRSGKHIKRHLEMVNPTEPVSVILTAGLQAERTLGCLARSLAAEYSATHNASILEINGTTKRAQDSDRVKLDIDEELRKAFEGDKPAAVVHHFEELPPGSTLIFYRYCDHENAAYKKVFLVFTVMLSVKEISQTTSLSAVEDMVHDHIKQKFIVSDKSTMFNQMDVDKLSGLWSRISHLILPVAAEEKIEQQGCGV
ncbi:torsin-1A-interacting protein 2 isoform X2 [Puntigrus tetrazona]|uniref:torsin-1A-interacting protein 2 isoform X2 n=1 Tax=Puntigrus tetrazona TaxID=1606681 RepID=UPI001C8A28D4|nr:torsin-1A-interacting protein 2 isoform X2 [Puntigrus tetrazona]